MPEVDRLAANDPEVAWNELQTSLSLFAAANQEISNAMRHSVPAT